jgi:two-component system sensor histidine kinase YesM
LLIAIIIFSSLFLASVLSILLSRYVSKPIIKLSLAMKHVKEKDFNISVPIRSSNEIGEISEGFNQMVGEVKRLFDDLVIEEEMKRKAQLEALHYQINPHFLHNTITSIGLYAALKGSNDILEMTNVLGRLLKNKISNPDILISLGEEIENIKDYIFILQIRYESKITIYYDIDENLLDAKIGSFFLQPIVENSIYHGLNSKLNLEDEEAILKISAYTDGDKIIVEVYDNGKGLTQEEIDHILEVEKEANSKHLADGIGIKNINHRIKFMYGEKFGINIESKVGHFTKVRLILPVESS